jgi:glucan phosphoethanolaminetransferase (alkaline phosphatase superfamily)
MDGSVQPGTMPMIMAWLLGLGAFFALFEGTSKDAPDIVLLKRSALFLAVLGLSLVLTLHVGFKWAAPVLSLSVMLLSYERRLAWMAVGAGLIPLMIWLLFDVFLGRPLV